MVLNRDWSHAAERLVGAFFLGSAIWKFYASQDISLAWALSTWESQGWIIGWYAKLLHLLLPYEAYLKAIVATAQGIAGALILARRRWRLAGVILFLVQITIFLGGFHKLSLRIFIGFSLWFALYCIFYPAQGKSWPVGRWSILTAVFFVLYYMHLFNLIEYKQHLPSEALWQRRTFATDDMPVVYAIKKVVLSLTKGEVGALVWVAPFWIQAVLFAGLFTPFRLWACACMLVIEICREWVWVATLGGYAVLCVLTVFLWCAREYEVQTRHGRYLLLNEFLLSIGLSGRKRA